MDEVGAPSAGQMQGEREIAESRASPVGVYLLSQPQRVNLHKRETISSCPI